MMDRALKTKRILTAVVLLACFCTGCSKKMPEEGGEEAELLLYCGAGIRPPVDELVSVFQREEGVKIVTDYAGSEVLLSKIKLCGKGDLYIPGDRHYIEQAEKEGLILCQRPICFFVPAILVQRGNPKKISGLQDLLRPGLRIGLGDPRACAIGRKSKEIFAQNNLAWEEVEKNLSFQSVTVNELGLQIQARALDAVIVWDAIAKYYGEYGDEVSIPPEQNILSTVNLGVLKFTKNRERAEKFLEFASSERGKSVFEKHHYRVKPPR